MTTSYETCLPPAAVSSSEQTHDVLMSDAYQHQPQLAPEPATNANTDPVLHLSHACSLFLCWDVIAHTFDAAHMKFTVRVLSSSECVTFPTIPP
jgi:hypothetical protein